MNNIATIDQQAPSNMLEVIARAASDPTVDIEKLERLLALKERMDGQQAEAAFNDAMSRVQASMGRIGADKTNKQTNSEYATYGKLDRVLRPLYTAEGFALSFGTDPLEVDCMVRVTCHASHKAGFTRKYLIDMPSDGKGAKGNDVMTKTHATGSATQYGMRYLLKMIFNVAIGDEDDDGNGASGADPVELQWIEVAQAIKIYPEYQSRKAEVLAAYGNKPANLPPAVREAFNKAAAETKPKDE